MRRPAAPRSRKLESEADHIGLLLLARTCRYSPAAAPGVLARLAQHSAAQRASGASGPPDLFSTHPSDAARAEAVRQWLPEAEAERAARCPEAVTDFWGRAAAAPPQGWARGAAP